MHRRFSIRGMPQAKSDFSRDRIFRRLQGQVRPRASNLGSEFFPKWTNFERLSPRTGILMNQVPVSFSDCFWLQHRVRSQSANFAPGDFDGPVDVYPCYMDSFRSQVTRKRFCQTSHREFCGTECSRLWTRLHARGRSCEQNRAPSPRDHLRDDGLRTDERTECIHSPRQPALL